jgi:hypothetical protein
VQTYLALCELALGHPSRARALVVQALEEAPGSESLRAHALDMAVTCGIGERFRDLVRDLGWEEVR